MATTIIQSQGVGKAPKILSQKEVKAKKRLHYIRKQIDEGNISYGEIAELQDLAEYIDKGDVVLREWAGIKEGF